MGENGKRGSVIRRRVDVAAVETLREGSPAEANADRLLTVKEAAARLAVSTDWLYRRHPRLPFTVRLGPGQVRFSERGIERYIEQRLGKRGMVRARHRSNLPEGT